MLNELYVAERAVQAAGLQIQERHPSLKEARKIPTLLIQLSSTGSVADLSIVPRDYTPWTLRDGQHNSFPFIQPKIPFWATPGHDDERTSVIDKATKDKRGALLSLEPFSVVQTTEYQSWPGPKFIGRTRERLKDFSSLKGSDSAVFPAVLERFLKACDPSIGGDPGRLVESISVQLIEKVKTFSEGAWIDIAIALLVGKHEKGTWSCSGGLLFDAAGEKRSVLHPELISSVSQALRSTDAPADSVIGQCALTGEEVRLHRGNFPQPNLPGLGQTYLFSKNKEIDANDRYGRFAAEAYPVGEDTMIRLEAGLSALTSDDRKNETWQMIPGEAPKQSDLLVAYVEGDPRIGIVPVLADDHNREEEEGDDDGEEDDDDNGNIRIDTVRLFLSQTGQVFEALKGNSVIDFQLTKIRIFVLRKLDPANRKVVYSGAMSIADLQKAAEDWGAGERNLPDWYQLYVYYKKIGKALPTSPLHISPLQLIGFSKSIYIRGGTERQETGGLTANEALRIFASTNRDSRPIFPVLRDVLRKRTSLLLGATHDLRVSSTRRKSKPSNNFDRQEVLRTATVLGVLLHKLGREKEAYMSDTAFRLGKLLAAMDIIHVGYCMDVRGGQIPPTLLGNQIFGMAQRNPATALSVLGKRLKPYLAWQTRAQQHYPKYKALASQDKADERQKAYSVLAALRQGRAIKAEAEELHGKIKTVIVDDVFHAELLLGYMAGIPRTPSDDDGTSSNSDETQD